MTGAPAAETCDVAVIGAGPAGLAAAEMLVAAGHAPVILEAKPSAARKFLMAGKSGLNLTMDEPAPAFARAFAAPVDPARLGPLVTGFGPAEIRAWAEALGEPLFTGSSGRVFPKAMKASPLLRKWLARLAAGGADLRTRWRWTGRDGPALRFETPEGVRLLHARATILALGGASWPRLGSDAAWAPVLAAGGSGVVPFKPANMGFERPWSAPFLERFAGAPVKPVALSFGGVSIRGEFTIARYGVEGGGIYALSAPVRDALIRAGTAAISLDLMPDLSEAALEARLSRPRGKLSRANFLRKAVGLTGVRAGLLRELAPGAPPDAAGLAASIKALPMPLTAPRPLAEAISSAGGLAWSALDDDLMLTARPGVFAAGEMVDWEAPTGGYLLTGCIAMGRHAGHAAARWLARPSPSSARP